MDNQMLIICAAVIVAVIFGMAILRLVMWVQWFRKELRYINKEIARTAGEEQQHWRKRKKRLIRSIIPFLGY